MIKEEINPNHIRIPHIDERIKAFNEKRKKLEVYYIADENGNILSEEGYKSKILAEKFFYKYQISPREKLTIVKLEGYEQ
jgi:hypothetical protein